MRGGSLHKSLSGKDLQSDDWIIWRAYCPSIRPFSMYFHSMRSRILLRFLFLAYVGYLSWLLLANDPFRWVGLSPDISSPFALIFQVAHLLSFTVLMLLGMAAQWPLPRWGLPVILGLYGLAMELLQGFTPLRRPEWSDFFQDCGGIVIGWGLWWIMASIRQSFQKPVPDIKV
jgi:hypothetical protein